MRCSQVLRAARMNLKKKKQKTGKRIDRKLYHSLMDPIGIY